MFDLGWSELLIVAVVAIIVVGPKDLPRMLRTVGKTMGQVRRTANDFRRQFDDALKEAEKEADLGDTKKELQALTKMEPLEDLKSELKSVKSAGDALLSDAGKPAIEGTHTAQPVKSAATGAVEAAAAGTAAKKAASKAGTKASAKKAAPAKSASKAAGATKSASKAPATKKPRAPSKTASKAAAPKANGTKSAAPAKSRAKKTAKPAAKAASGETASNSDTA